MGFYDAKGYWRNDGDGFYDAKGYFRSPGDGFYDYKGYFRNAGDGFYDARGNWVNPGGTFYDSKGYSRSYGVAVAPSTDTGQGIVAAVGFILFIPIALLWAMTIFLIEWIISHLYVTFIGYVVMDIFLCFIITKIKKHQGVKFAFSFIGNYACILSFIYITLIYAVPDAIRSGGSFDSFFNFTLVLAFSVGGIAVMQFFNYYHEKAFLEFILGILFFIVVIQMLKSGSNELNNVESLAKIYNTDASTIFRVLFGFAI